MKKPPLCKRFPRAHPDINQSGEWPMDDERLVGMIAFLSHHHVGGFANKGCLEGTGTDSR
jgi:hypothetical protein